MLGYYGDYIGPKVSTGEFMSASNSVPDTIQGFALMLNDDPTAPSSSRISLKTKPMPSLEKGQVLVKVLAAPVNPSDLVHLIGKYGISAQEGSFVGFEACGEVVQENAGLYGKYLLGKRVALSAQPGKDGVWADYAITKANYCLPLDRSISNEQGATLIVNPCTAVCLVDRALSLGAKSLVLNAAASQVGRGVINYAKSKGVQTIAIVRKPEQIDILNQLGASVVLNSADEKHLLKLKDNCERLKASVLLDALAAKETAITLKAMPKGSTAIVYGRLTETQNPLGGEFSVADVIFRDIKIEGFWLANFVARSSPLQIYLMSKKVQSLFKKGIFKTDIYSVVGFEDFKNDLDYYAKHKSIGKVILNPQLSI